MRTKEEHYELIKKLREIAADPKNSACPCPKTKCEWHGNCRDCVTIHRYNADHFPNCFQQVFNDRIKAVSAMGEMTASPKEMTPGDYWDYVRQKDMEAQAGAGEQGK